MIADVSAASRHPGTVTTSHRRFNPLTGDWVLVSPHRLARPWLGRTEAVRAGRGPSYDPNCYLCPGNARAGTARNPVYERTFVFDNDFPALLPHAGGAEHVPDADGRGLLVSHPEPGLCRVVCFSPRHDASLPDLSSAEARDVVDVWTAQYEELGRMPWVRHVQIFENRGSAVGASNPHPHCQIWADGEVPPLPRREGDAQSRWRDAHGSCLLCDYLALERERGERIVWSSDTFTALVPYWAVWPYELLLLSNRHASGLDRLAPGERDGLAAAVQNVVGRYDRLFDAECPYSMGFHQRPTDDGSHDAWHLHAHYYPPVLRSATVHKFMVGYELLAMPQRDLTPELAAAALREARP
jgi:UDPglucose--hexose-1-phosphate uridylyltransferase